jgi:hypothetical protein
MATEPVTCTSTVQGTVPTGARRTCRLLLIVPVAASTVLEETNFLDRSDIKKEILNEFKFSKALTRNYHAKKFYALRIFKLGVTSYRINRNLPGGI